MICTGPLAEPVAAFVEEISATLGRLSATGADQHRQEAIVEASDIAAGVIASDARLSRAELDGYLDALGALLDPPLMASSEQLRTSHLFDGKADELRAPSVLFDLLVRADARDGTRTSHRYYELALRLAHSTAALDLVPSTAELEVIDSMRTQLLHHLDAFGVPRPGQVAPPAPPRPPATPPVTPSGTPPVSPSAAATNAEAPTAAAPATLPPARPINELLAELDALVGLANVKAEVRRLSSLLQVQQLRRERGMPIIETSHHLVFTGNPGTGKTTVARLLAQIYRSVGIVSKGQLVETDRSKLVAGYVGQTALKTAETLNAALGGMLLIDEAYALARGGENDFGKEAIDTLVKFMEDHRDDLAIVAAGYPTEMQELIETNPGLKSRFTRTITFPDYTDDELVSIFDGLCNANEYNPSDDAMARVCQLIGAEPRTRGFGNARFVRNLFETAVSHQAQRLAPLGDLEDEQLTTLTADDIAAVDS
jgi:Holliday junction resolvasome RuvABC ATP-dependent DNA helicase subunit